MVRRTIAIDLTKKNVTLADFSQEVLQSSKNKCNLLTTLQLDVTKKEPLKQSLQPYDLVVCAVPGFLGFETL